jgi:hypothetical protein
LGVGFEVQIVQVERVMKYIKGKEEFVLGRSKGDLPQ